MAVRVAITRRSDAAKACCQQQEHPGQFPAQAQAEGCKRRRMQGAAVFRLGQIQCARQRRQKQQRRQRIAHGPQQIGEEVIEKHKRIRKGTRRRLP